MCSNGHDGGMDERFASGMNLLLLSVLLSCNVFVVINGMNYLVL
jgi:hypothetical protein